MRKKAVEMQRKAQLDRIEAKLDRLLELSSVEQAGDDSTAVNKGVDVGNDALDVDPDVGDAQPEPEETETA